jgi:hypothetical protein
LCPHQLEILMSKIVGVQVNARSNNCLVEQSFPAELAFQLTREAPMVDKLKGAVIALSIVALAQLIVMYPVDKRGSYTLQSTVTKPYPEVDDNTVVLIEIRPAVGDITFHAYFMDFSPEKNLNLCLAGKNVFDRDAEAIAKAQNRTATSYRQCLTLPQAVAKGYISPR